VLKICEIDNLQHKVYSVDRTLSSFQFNTNKRKTHQTMKSLAKRPEFIINSLLDLDFYKLTMGNFIHRYFPTVPIQLSFTCRTKGIALPDTVKEADLRRELDHVMTLRFSEEELSYLKSIPHSEGRNLFSDEYVEFLRTLQLPQYELEYRGSQIYLIFPGEWGKSTYWETISLSIINELHYRSEMDSLTVREQEARYTLGHDRLMRKIKILKQHPQITFSDFGTRRRFSGAWQEYVVRTLQKKLASSQFVGTSNVFLAMKLGLQPIGTNAHELPMVLATLMQDTDDELKDSQAKLRRLWFELYGEKLAINLSDTFGSEFVFQTMLKEEAEKWIGFRQDSGIPLVFGERVIRFYKDHGIKTEEKLIVFSDGLDIETIVELESHFHGRIRVTFGWGTNLTNDLGFDPLSLVVKVTYANGHFTVKLSDTLGKATGPQEEKDRYIRVFMYADGKAVKIVY